MTDLDTAQGLKGNLLKEQGLFDGLISYNSLKSKWSAAGADRGRDTHSHTQEQAWA